MNAITITDMAGASVEHSSVIVNFAAMVKSQLKGSLCRVYTDNVKYKWQLADDSEKVVIPDASINCQIRARRGNSFIIAPQFVMEVLSPSTADYDRGEKLHLYEAQEIPEYWIVDWRNREIYIYDLDYQDDVPKYYLFKIIHNENKDELRMIHMPNVKIDFDELFDID